MLADPLGLITQYAKLQEVFLSGMYLLHEAIPKTAFKTDLDGTDTKVDIEQFLLGLSLLCIVLTGLGNIHKMKKENWACLGIDLFLAGVDTFLLYKLEKTKATLKKKPQDIELGPVPPSQQQQQHQEQEQRRWEVGRTLRSTRARANSNARNQQGRWDGPDLVLEEVWVL